MVYCFDAYVGTPIWSFSYPDGPGKDKTPETTTTPTVDTNGCVYTMGHEGQIFCFNKVTGAVLWSTNSANNWESEWCDAGSPIVYNNMLICNCGGGWALDKTTGASMWGNAGTSGFGSPKIYIYNSQPILLMPTLSFPHGGGYDSSACGINVLTGAWLAGWDFGARYGEDPEFYGTNEFFCGGTLYQMTNTGLTPLWGNNMNTAYAACLVYGNYVYGFGGGGQHFTCQSLANGAIMWDVNPNIGDAEGAMMASDGKIICLDGSERLFAWNANPTNYDIGGRAPYQMSFEPYGGSSPSGPRAIPALANGLLYCRDYGSFSSTNYVNYNLCANLICLSCGNVSGGPTGIVQFSSAAYSVSESAGVANIQVSRISGSSGAITVNYATANGTALAGSDYTATTGTLSFAAGQASKMFSIPIANAGIVGGSKTVNLSLSNITGGATMGSPINAVLTIMDDDSPGALQFGNAAYVVAENGGSAVIQVSRTGGSIGAISVNYATANGTGMAGSDYTLSSGILNFAGGETTKTFTVPVINNGISVSDKTVSLLLSNPTGGSSLGTISNAVLTIVYNDGGPAAFQSWTNRMKIKFGGYNRPETLTNFPALVVLNTSLAGFSYGQFASPNGNDLRFSTPDGSTNLNYEMDQWNTNGNSCVWVQVPQLLGGSYIWAYWGNPAVASAPPVYTTNGAVWPTNKYAAVWHMAQSNALDSTANRNNGIAMGSITNAPGEIDGAQGVAASYAQLADSPSLDFTAASATISAWVCFNAVPNGEQAITRKDNQWALEANGTKMRNLINTSGANQSGWTAGNDDSFNPPLIAGEWYYFAFAYNGAASNLCNFENGVQIGAHVVSGTNNVNTFNSAGLGGCSGGEKIADALIDEVRVEPVFRSTNWIWASYATVALNSSFNVCGIVLHGGGGSTSNVPPSAWIQQYYPGTPASNYVGLAGSEGSNGLTVWQDYLVGMNPTNPSSSFSLVITNAAGQIIVSVPSVQATGSNYVGVSRYYEIDQCSNLLSGGSWQPVPGYTGGLLASGGVIASTNTAQNNATFYRAKVLLQ